MPISAAHCAGLGVAQTQTTARVAMPSPMALLTSRICHGPSRPERRLMKMSSAPRHTAAPSARRAPGSMTPLPGRIRIAAPARPMAAAPQRTGPTRSPSSGIASIIPKTGLRKLIAVASDSGMKAAAANISVTPAQPKPERLAWVAKSGRVRCGRISAVIVPMARKAKRNRPWLTCSAWSGGPSASVPSAFASSVVPASSAAARSVSRAARAGSGARGENMCFSLPARRAGASHFPLSFRRRAGYADWHDHDARICRDPTPPHPRLTSPPVVIPGACCATLSRSLTCPRPCGTQGASCRKDHAMIPSILPTYNRAPLSFVKGEGSWLIESDGRRFLDLGAGIAVNVLGHAHPDLVTALTEQAGALWHTSNLYQIPKQQELADRLVETTFADTVFFTNSGTESCELAVKMARKHFHEAGQPERTGIIAFEGAFHGRSTAAIAAAGSEKMVKGFGPLMPGFTQVPWGDHDALHAAIDDTTAAILIEPVQGEGGIRPLPDQCLKGLRALCDEKGILLIAEEVQCGMGRTGKLCAHEWAGVDPDIMMVAKGIGGGFPLGAVLATERAARGMVAGTHGSTYGGNPLGCAVGCAVMQHVTAPEFLEEVRRKSGLLRQKLEGLVAAHPEIFEDVRGSGLMLGLICKATNTDVVKAGYDALVVTVPAADNVIRLLPPLTITDDEIAEAVSRLDAAASAVETA